MRRIKHVRARRVHPGALTRPGHDVLDQADYVDAFELAAGAGSDGPEQWARATFEGAPRLTRWVVLSGWRALGFRLGPQDSRDHVLGGTIVEATPARIVLGVDSLVIGQARLVTEVEESRVLLSTVVRFGWRGAGAVWSLMGPIHRQILPYLLTHAGQRSSGIA